MHNQYVHWPHIYTVYRNQLLIVAMRVYLPYSLRRILTELFSIQFHCVYLFYDEFWDDSTFVFIIICAGGGRLHIHRFRFYV